MAEVKKEEVKKPGTAVTEPAKTGVDNWQDKLKALAVKTAEVEKPSGNWASFRSGIFTINGVRMKDNKVEAIMLHAAFENQFYKNKFDPNKYETPVCFALSEDGENMVPHKDSPEPQAATCDECSRAVWGTGDNGKGKACKNVRRLAFMASTDLEGDIAKAEVVLAKIPVTSAKNYSTYASQLSNVLHIAPLQAVTEMHVVPDAATQFQVNFGFIRRIEDEGQLRALLARREDIHPLIFAPYSKATALPEGVRDPSKPQENKKY